MLLFGLLLLFFQDLLFSGCALRYILRDLLLESDDLLGDFLFLIPVGHAIHRGVAADLGDVFAEFKNAMRFRHLGCCRLFSDGLALIAFLFLGGSFLRRAAASLLF